MWERLRSIWTVPDLRKKILFTLGMLVILRLLAHITVPLTLTEKKALFDLFNTNKNQNLGQLLGLLDVFSGGSLQTFSIVALGIYPYLIATMVIQLLLPIIPSLANLATQGESGRLRLGQLIGIITVPLAFLQASGTSAIFQKVGVLQHFSLVDPAYALESLALLLSLTAGTMILVWIGELITELGIGKGIWLIIFAGAVSRLPSFVQQGYAITTSSGGSGIVSIGVFLIIGLITILGIVYIYQGQRRVPVQYPTKRMVRGLLVGSAQTSYIPMQVNSAGMIPIIFTQSILLFVAAISQYLAASLTSWLRESMQWVATWLVNPLQWWYWACYFVLVVVLTYSYAYIAWQQQNIAENLQKQGAFLPGIRPGEATHRYLQDIFHRITLAGALLLGIAAALPFIAYLGGNQLLSSASVLILPAVVLDIVSQLEAQMVMRNYPGFL